jgi:hypothetical protein
MSSIWKKIIMNENPYDYVRYLLNGVQWNDSLLEGYRSFHLTMQSIFIAIGAGVSVANLNFRGLAQSASAILILTALAVLGIYIILKMHKIIIDRGYAVDAWSKELIRAEKELPIGKRQFTQSKIEGRGFNFTAAEIDEDKINQLVRKGYARKILDKWLFIGIGVVWSLLLAINFVYLFSRIFGIL